MEKSSFSASFPTRQGQVYTAFRSSSWAKGMFFYNFLKHSLMQCSTGIKSPGIAAAGRAGWPVAGGFREGISAQQMVSLS